MTLPLARDKETPDTGRHGVEHERIITAIRGVSLSSHPVS